MVMLHSGSMAPYNQTAVWVVNIAASIKRAIAMLTLVDKARGGLAPSHLLQALNLNFSVIHFLILFYTKKMRDSRFILYRGENLVERYSFTMYM